MKNLTRFLIPILILIITACTKGGGNVYFSGKVYNAVTGEGISGVEIKLIKSNPFAGDPLSGETTVEQALISDAKGRFEIIETIGSTSAYWYIVNHPGYELIGWEVSGDESPRKVRNGEEDYDNLKLVPYGDKEFDMDNVICNNSADSMQFRRTYLLTGESQGWSDFRLGCYSYQGVGQYSIGDYRYDWYVIRNGVRTDSTKIVTVHENDTTLVELFY